jgi:hypothetical protein
MFESGESVRSRFWPCDCTVIFLSVRRTLSNYRMAECAFEYVCGNHPYGVARIGDAITLPYECLERTDLLKQFVIEARKQAGKE